MKKIGGDQGYSGNDNRTFCKENKIETSFTQERPDRQERGEECNQAGTCQSESDSDGRLVWNSERTLRTS